MNPRHAKISLRRIEQLEIALLSAANKNSGKAFGVNVRDCFQTPTWPCLVCETAQDVLSAVVHVDQRDAHWMAELKPRCRSSWKGMILNLKTNHSIYGFITAVLVIDRDEGTNERNERNKGREPKVKGPRRKTNSAKFIGKRNKLVPCGFSGMWI